MFSSVDSKHTHTYSPKLKKDDAGRRECIVIIDPSLQGKGIPRRKARRRPGQEEE
jgi:hypothetical protein